jgi:phosphoribosylamine--glycine ligase
LDFLHTKNIFIKMVILLLGGGGREHAFAWKLSESPLCEQLYIAPGNAGTRQHGTNVDIDPNDFEGIKNFVLTYGIDMLIVGPEEPLVRGIVDFFRAIPACQHLKIIGPAQKGALLEGSKAFAKEWMQEYQIPTAAYREFSLDSLQDGLNYLDTHSLPIVLKADGLAAGKGVIISTDRAEAKRELQEMLQGKFGTASNKVVVEQFLSGIEFSVFALTDGVNYHILPVAKDYKRIGEGDTGLNTGGMGAVSPPPFVTETLMEKVKKQIVEPTMRGIVADNMDYKGFVFFGLIAVNGEPFVIEYNCRMGDPETEVVLPRIKNDLVELLTKTADQELNEVVVEISPQAAATVMLVAGGYPSTYQKGAIMTGWENIQNALLFHAGTADYDQKIVTNGGRVLAVTALAETWQEAVKAATKNADQLKFEGKYYRKDIGFDLG